MTANAKNSKVKPLGDNVLLEPLQRETTTASGIVIPDTVKEKPQEGTVVAVGPGKLNDKGEKVKPEVKVGDVVMYKKWGGNELKVDGKELLLVKIDDILAIIEG